MPTIYHDLIIKRTTEEVFKDVSNPKDLENWWPFKCSGEPKVGTAYNFRDTDDWYGKVIKSVSSKSFYIKMTKSDKDWNPTTFGFDLEGRKDGSTYMVFWHKD